MRWEISYALPYRDSSSKLCSFFFLFNPCLYSFKEFYHLTTYPKSPYLSESLPTADSSIFPALLCITYTWENCNFFNKRVHHQQNITWLSRLSNLNSLFNKYTIVYFRKSHGNFIYLELVHQNALFAKTIKYHCKLRSTGKKNLDIRGHKRDVLPKCWHQT